MIRGLRNLIFLISSITLLTINFLFLSDKKIPAEVFFIILNIIISVIIVLDVIYNLKVFNKVEFLERENRKKDFIIEEYKLETSVLTTITEIIEKFGEEITTEEMIDQILTAIRNIFKNETVALFLFGEKYIFRIQGENINLPINLLEDMAIKGRPILVNNISSFSKWEELSKQKITSFVISALYYRRSIAGLLGVFSSTGKKFTLKDLDLLRMISIPISLMIENTELFTKVKILSVTDSLTSLYNRRYFEKIVEELLLDAQKNHRLFSICMCDIDFFKNYNDKNGHIAGDFVLKTVAEILKKGIKGKDIVARYGGEEFIIAFPETSKDDAQKICEKLRKSIKEFKFPNEESQPNKDITVSFGISSFPEDGLTLKELIEAADKALYKAKEMGRDRVILA